MNDALKKNEKYQKRYMKRHKMLCVLLCNEKDKDIIDWLRTPELFTTGFPSVQFLIRSAKLPHFSAEFQKNMSSGCFLPAPVCSFGLCTELYQHTALVWLSALTQTCRADSENLVCRCSCKICTSFCSVHRARNRIL